MFMFWGVYVISAVTLLCLVHGRFALKVGFRARVTNRMMRIAEVMPPVRRQRLAAVVFLLLGSGLTIGAVLFALQENVDFFTSRRRL
ncbi:MAG: hypothetical protein Ct9H300mP8_06030 [Gammaproteobacteria bacterium]|nr:MAG: hypothetical protein Ct9H300mP8_06030 [Gammaproteobacteria bacterium]